MAYPQGKVVIEVEKKLHPVMEALNDLAEAIPGGPWIVGGVVTLCLAAFAVWKFQKWLPFKVTWKKNAEG